MKTFRRRQAGQVAVETAIVMPLFVFIMLGLLQLGLMYQGRILAKYAAYKAARAGALHRAKLEPMKAAALSVLLPMAGRDTDNSSFYRTADPTEFKQSWDTAYTSLRGKQAGSVEVADVTVCYPTSGSIDSDTDFDDVRALQGKDSADWKQHDRSKLAIQVTFNFRMVVPFVNGVIFYMALGDEDKELRRTLRMFSADDKQRVIGTTYNGNRTIKDLEAQAKQHKYFLPIRASYAMRMQSNVAPDANLPSKNLCRVPWQKKE